jgi:hypothetical protein
MLGCGFPDVTFDTTTDAGADPASFDAGGWDAWAKSAAGSAESSESASATHASADSGGPGAAFFDAAADVEGDPHVVDGGSAPDGASGYDGGSGGGPDSGPGVVGSSGGSGGGGGSSSGGGHGSSGGGSSGGAGDGSACNCSSNQTLYPTGVDCAAIAVDATLPSGQAKTACQKAAGFAEATLACGQQGIYVTCAAASNAAGAGRPCQVATQVPMLQQCH